MFLEMQLNLCNFFPGLTPFEIRKQAAYEIFLLIRRLNRYSERKGSNQTKVTKTGSGKDEVIRIPASDNWY